MSVAERLSQFDPSKVSPWPGVANWQRLAHIEQVVCLNDRSFVSVPEH